MSTRPPSDGHGHDPKIIELFTAEDEAGAEDLARYWDATLQGLPADPGSLDPELTAVARLLRHYHGVTCCHSDGPFTPGPGPEFPTAHPARQDANAPSPRAANQATWREAPRPLMSATLALVAIFTVVFVINTLTSPRSWLLSTASDPDWIPWVSDDWISLATNGLIGAL